MKKPSSVQGVALWVVGGLLGLYLLGGAAIWADDIYLHGKYSRMLPEFAQEALYVAYDPFFSVLGWLLASLTE